MMAAYAPVHDQISYRSLRYRMGLLGTASSRPENRRSTQGPQPTYYPRCDLLYLEEWLLLAPASPRLPSLENRLPLLPRVASRQCLRADQHGTARATANSLGEERAAQRGHSGLTVGQERRCGR